MKTYLAWRLGRVGRLRSAAMGGRVLGFLASAWVLVASAETGVGHWAYRPPAWPVIPVGVDAAAWAANDIDRFVLAGIEKAGVAPAAPADRETLCRRVYFDLIGLPPAPREIDAFLADARPEALSFLVDRLLASPRFGEHWARHWFDVVRFGESVSLRGFVFREAWRYRDYVIRAFNDDVPVDRFLREQIAGDLMPAESLEARQRQLVATTFLMLGNTNLEEQDKKQMEMDVVDEQLDVLGKGFLGQTLSCARCHDHKFDPIPIRDYYAMAGILKNSLAIRHDNVSAWIERPLPLPPAEEEALSAHERGVDSLRAELQAARQKKATNDIPVLEKRLKERISQGPIRPKVMAPREPETVADIPVHRRGSVHSLGEVVPRGFLSALAHSGLPVPGTRESGRRELAEWVTSPSNPLTARVFVNRVWLWLVGEGLVRTPDNFGTTGEPPTHPELLDALALAFSGRAASALGSSETRTLADDGREPEVAPRRLDRLRPWSLKSLVRMIVLSNTYGMSCDASPLVRNLDPANRLLSRAFRKRLGAEAMRDAMLSASGSLKLEPPVGPTFPVDRAADYGFVSDVPWRSVYLPVFRNAIPEIFRVFDFPVASLVTGRRAESTVASQSLFLLNDPFVREQAAAAARRLVDHGAAARDAESPAEGILDRRASSSTGAAAEVGAVDVFRLFRRVLGRSPDAEEIRLVLARCSDGDEAGSALTDVIHALFATPEFQSLR